MRALVLGGSGFIGAHLVRRLISDGHDVAILDVATKPEFSHIECFEGSHEDPELLARATRARDMVFHLISTTVPATSNQNIEFDIQSNLVSTVQLLTAMVDQGVQRICYLSSGGAVYGNPESYPVPESHPLQPISSYGVVKVAVEKYLFMFEQLHGLQPLIIRPSNAYGPGQNIAKPQGVIGHFLASAIRGDSLQVWGDGSIRRDYLYVDDLVDLIAKAVVTGETGVFNAGAGKDVSVREIISNLEQVLGRSLPIEHLEPRSFDVKAIRLDISKAQQALRWEPQVELLDGIQRQYDSLKGTH